MSRRAYIDEQASQINQFVNLIYGLLALAILIAVFGMANTLSLSVYERTRELGLLRAVGAYRSQIRSSVRWESVITALLGAVQGIVVGVLLGYAIIVALHDQGLRRSPCPSCPSSFWCSSLLRRASLRRSGRRVGPPVSTSSGPSPPTDLCVGGGYLTSWVR